MRLEASDPDLETLVTRIDRGDIDLQPQFQRGEVWPTNKKQRLIDSILRDWHVPPIHVIELKESRKQEVLDGQQRLAAIHDFARDNLVVRGDFDPVNYDIKKLDGLRFSQLPEEWKRRFNQFTIRVFRIVDYNPSEPGELFFRLNQPTSLTSAETRNAFFGPVRTQIKDLVDRLNAEGLDREYLGFSNARMAFDDVMARVAVTVDRNSIAKKVTANDLVLVYRSSEPLPGETIRKVESAIDLISKSRQFGDSSPKFNRATVYSWFLFVIRASAVGGGNMSPKLLGKFQREFRNKRELEFLLGDDKKSFESWLIAVYLSRSTARVADVSSVVLRDLVMWFEFARFLEETTTEGFEISRLPVKAIEADFRNSAATEHWDEEELVRIALAAGWGTLL
jgi:hypothetical protein